MTTQALERAEKAVEELVSAAQPIYDWDAKQIARAVLMAVRTLDDETKQRGSVIYCEGKSGLFTAMIDAILGEGEGE